MAISDLAFMRSSLGASGILAFLMLTPLVGLVGLAELALQQIAQLTVGISIMARTTHLCKETGQSIWKMLRTSAASKTKFQTLIMRISSGGEDLQFKRLLVPVNVSL